MIINRLYFSLNPLPCIKTINTSFAKVFLLPNLLKYFYYRI